MCLVTINSYFVTAAWCLYWYLYWFYLTDCVVLHRFGVGSRPWVVMSGLDLDNSHQEPEAITVPEYRISPQITSERPQINVWRTQITIPRPQNTANHSLNTAKHCKSVLEDRKLSQIIPGRPQITANYCKSLQEDHNSMLEDRKSLSQDHRTPQIYLTSSLITMQNLVVFCHTVCT